MYIISFIARYFLCLIPYIILMSNKDIIYHITGPITISPFKEEKDNLIYLIAFIEFFRVFYQPLMGFIRFILWKLNLITFQRQNKRLLIHSLTLKYAFVLILKLFVIFYEIHRLKYYLHVFFIELFIVAINILADVVNNPKVSLVMDIVLVDSLNRVALFYELTRTFNPNFGLYFFGNNLITLICYMLQGDRKQVLYVKHDIYRIMIVTFAYLFLFSLFQSSVTFRPLLIFILTSYFFLKTIQSYSSDTNDHKNEKQNIEQPNPNGNRLIMLNGRIVYLKAQNDKPFFKNYFEKIKKNQAFLYFICLLIITFGIEIISIQQNSINQATLNSSSQQTLRNSFMEFYMTKNKI